MSWFPLEQTLWTHRKTYALAEALGIDEVHAGGLVARLWAWSLDNAQPDWDGRRGLLTGVVPLAIAGGAGWKGAPDVFLQALTAAGFLDQDGDELVIHDWFDHAGRLLERRRHDRERKRAAAEKASRAANKSAGSRPKAIPQESRGNSAEPARNNRGKVAATVQTLLTESLNSTEERAPLPPTPLVSVQSAARERDAVGALTLEATATSPPASLHAANGEARGVRGGEARLGDAVSRRGPAAPVPSRPPGASAPAQAVPLRAVPKPHELERAQTEAHPLFEPLVDLFGRPPTRELTAWRDDLAALEEMGATPEDIPRAVAGYARSMGVDATGRPILLTRAALVRHWHRCLDPTEPARITGDYVEPTEAGAITWMRRHGIQAQEPS